MVLRFCDVCGKILPTFGKNNGYFNKDIGSFDFCDDCYDDLPEDSKLLQETLTTRNMERLKDCIFINIMNTDLSNKPSIKMEI